MEMVYFLLMDLITKEKLYRLQFSLINLLYMLPFLSLFLNKLVNFSFSFEDL